MMEFIYGATFMGVIILPILIIIINKKFDEEIFSLKWENNNLKHLISTLENEKEGCSEHKKALEERNSHLEKRISELQENVIRIQEEHLEKSKELDKLRLQL